MDKLHKEAADRRKSLEDEFQAKLQKEREKAELDIKKLESKQKFEEDLLKKQIEDLKAYQPEWRKYISEKDKKECDGHLDELINMVRDENGTIGLKEFKEMIRIKTVV